MTLTERQVELICEHARTETPHQFDAWRTGGEPKHLREETEDRRAWTVGRWMQCDPSDAHGYICDDLSDATIREWGSLLKCGDDEELLRKVKQYLLSASMCDGAERFFRSAP